MREQELRALIENVREGELPRRAFIQRMVGLVPHLTREREERARQRAMAAAAAVAAKH